MREYHHLVDRDGRIVHDRTEILDPGTLERDDGDFYCRVRHGAFHARCGRIALQPLMPLVDDCEGDPAVRLDQARYRIARRPPPAPDMS